MWWAFDPPVEIALTTGAARKNQKTRKTRSGGKGMKTIKERQEGGASATRLSCNALRTRTRSVSRDLLNKPHTSKKVRGTKRRKREEEKEIPS